MSHYGHMTSLRKTLTSVVLFATAVLPFQASAATPSPQSVLDAALTSLMAQTSMRAEMELNMNVQKRTLKTRTYSPDSMVKLRMSQRTAPAIDGRHDSEGKLVIEGFETEGGTLKLAAPFTIEWKKVGTSAYIRVMTLPAELTDALAQLDIDPTPLVGKWLQIDLKGSLLEEGLAKEVVPNADLSSLRSMTSLPSLKQILRVVRVESTTTGADGHKRLRLRTRLNPTLVTQLQQREVAAVPKGTSRAAQVKEINARYAKLRTVLAGLHMVVVVDQTSQTVERVELGMEQVEPTKECTWNDSWTKETCKTVGYKKTKFAIGISFFAERVAAIVAPLDAQPIEEAFKSIAPPTPEPLDELDLESSMEM